MSAKDDIRYITSGFHASVDAACRKMQTSIDPIIEYLEHVRELVDAAEEREAQATNQSNKYRDALFIVEVRLARAERIIEAARLEESDDPVVHDLMTEYMLEKSTA